jgi:hypothetical protein
MSLTGDLGPLGASIEAELVMAESSSSDGPFAATDAVLPFDVAAVAAYEVRLRELQDAVQVMGSTEIAGGTIG